jgi:hypothetical protein
MPPPRDDADQLLSTMSYAKAGEWMEGRGAAAQQTLSQSPELCGHFSQSIFFGLSVFFGLVTMIQ